jgi:hypothetical protein
VAGRREAHASGPHGSFTRCRFALAKKNNHVDTVGQIFETMAGIPDTQDQDMSKQDTVIRISLSMKTEMNGNHTDPCAMSAEVTLRPTHLRAEVTNPS